MSRRAAIAGTLAAVALSLMVAGVAFADRDSDIQIHADDTEVQPVVGGVITVCEFHLHAIPLGTDDDGREDGTWRITNIATGALVESGDYEVVAPPAGPVTPDRIPDSGVFTLPEGNYNLWWDDEPFAPGSHLEKDFAVVCGGSQPTPSPNPTPGNPTPSPAPTSSAAPTPSGSAAPTASTGPTASATQPGGSVLPTTGTSASADVTLPPTDGGVIPTSTAKSDSSAWPVAIVLGVLALVAFLLTPRPRRASNRIRPRR